MCGSRKRCAHCWSCGLRALDVSGSRVSPLLSSGPDEIGTEINTPPKPTTQDDCQRFANIVAELASLFPDLSQFRDALYDRFNNRSRPGFDYNEFRSTGFKEEFRDETEAYPGANDISPNQVYHYVGGFRAGFSLGRVIGVMITEDHENEYEHRVGAGALPIPGGGLVPLRKPDTLNHRADKALFDVSVRHGSMVRSGKAKPFDVADMIRRDVCVH